MFFILSKFSRSHYRHTKTYSTTNSPSRKSDEQNCPMPQNQSLRNYHGPIALNDLSA